MHVDHAGWGPVRGSDLVRRGQLLSVDAGNDIPGFDPGGVDLYVPTVEALRRIHGADLDVEELLERAVAGGCDVVVATGGSKGSWARSADGSTAHAPAHAVDVLSTLGAGDVFHGALVAAVVRDLPFDQQLAFANITAALSCQALDGRSGIPDSAALLDAMSTAATTPDVHHPLTTCDHPATSQELLMTDTTHPTATRRTGLASVARASGALAMRAVDQREAMRGDVRWLPTAQRRRATRPAR